MIKSVIDSEELKGKEGETVYLHLVDNGGIKSQRLLLVGVGERRRIHDDAGLPDGGHRNSCPAQ